MTAGCALGAHISGTLREVDPEQRKCQLATTNHNWGALGFEVVQELACTTRHVIARLKELITTRDTQSVIEVKVGRRLYITWRGTLL